MPQQAQASHEQLAQSVQPLAEQAEQHGDEQHGLQQSAAGAAGALRLPTARTIEERKVNMMILFLECGRERPAPQRTAVSDEFG